MLYIFSAGRLFYSNFLLVVLFFRLLSWIYLRYYVMWSFLSCVLCLLSTLTTEHQLNPHKTKSHRILCNTIENHMQGTQQHKGFHIGIQRNFKEKWETKRKIEWERESNRDKDEKTTTHNTHLYMYVVFVNAQRSRAVRHRGSYGTSYERERIETTITVW